MSKAHNIVSLCIRHTVQYGPQGSVGNPMDDPAFAVWLLEVIGRKTLDTAVPVAPFLWHLHATSMASKVDEDGIVFLDCQVDNQILERACDGIPGGSFIAQTANSRALDTSLDEKVFYPICVGNSSFQILCFHIKIYIDANGKGKQAPWQAEEARLVEERAVEER
jgi:hypothetical protein